MEMQCSGLNIRRRSHRVIFGGPRFWIFIWTRRSLLARRHQSVAEEKRVAKGRRRDPCNRGEWATWSRVGPLCPLYKCCWDRIGSRPDPYANLSAAVTTPASCGCTGARMRIIVSARQKRVCQRCQDPLGKPSPFGGLRHVLGECKVPGVLDSTHSLILLNIQRFAGTLGARATVYCHSIFDSMPSVAALSCTFTFKYPRLSFPSNKKSLSQDRFR